MSVCFSRDLMGSASGLRVTTEPELRLWTRITAKSSPRKAPRKVAESGKDRRERGSSSAAFPAHLRDHPSSALHASDAQLSFLQVKLYPFRFL